MIDRSNKPAKIYLTQLKLKKILLKLSYFNLFCIKI